MKVILFIDSLDAGGAQRQISSLAVLLRQKGHDAQVAVYHDATFFAGYLTENGVPSVTIPHADSPLTRIPAIIRYFHRQRPDWVIAYLESPSIFACLAKVLGGKFRLIVSERNTTQWISWREKVRFFLFRFADWIVPNSHSQEMFLRNYRPALSPKVRTITNFVDLERFHPVCHIRRECPEIVVAATVWPSKNTARFIEAVRLAKERGCRFHVSWYGYASTWQQYYDECQSLIAAYGLADTMALLEKSPHIDEIYRAADYFCLPSLFEGTPNVLCEAIASGLPVICSNVCDNGIYVQEGMNGCLFDPTDPHDMAEAMERILSVTPQDYQTLRRHSRILAGQLLSSERFIDSYLQLMAGADNTSDH